jgi:hypothetical protein
MALNTPENPVRIPYFHSSIPDHVNDLRKQAENPHIPREGNGEKVLPMEGVVYESSHIKLLLEALRNPKHPLRQQAEQAVGGFAVAADKAGVRTIRSSAREFKVPVAYEVVGSLSQAAEVTGIPAEELMTIQDITDEWNLNRRRIQEWKNTGPQGQPRLTPLPVRLKGASGAPQLLFSRSEVERLVANPPKPGRPWR